MKETKKTKCLTGELFNMDGDTKNEAMRKIERFVEANGLRIEGEDGKFTESWEMTRQNGPHQIPTFTLIDLLERKWIDIDTIIDGVEFSRTHGYAANKEQLMNKDQKLFWEDEQFLALDPIDMFHHAARAYVGMLKLDDIGDIIRNLSGLELKSFKRLMEL
jgi:hypothetical protein